MCDGVEKTKADFPGDGSQFAAGTSGLECRPNMAAEELEQDGSPFKALSHARRRSSLGGLNLFTSLFLLEQVNERILAAVFELSWIKMTRLGVDDVSGEIE
jgi:hypothetical protein